MKAPLPANDTARLEALYQYNILDTAAEEVFDDFTSLAAQICETPIALFTLVDNHRQWVKSKVGLALTETTRENSFCTHTILGNEVFVVQDALADERFATNPLVTAEPHIRFYAGAPLLTSQGYALGTLCVIDYMPRELTAKQLGVLQALSRQVMTQLELRRTLGELAQTKQENQLLEKKLLRREQELLDLFENGTIGLHCLDANGIILWVNQAELDLLGYTREEYVGRHMADFHADEAVIDQILQRLTRNETLNNYEARLRCKDGSIRYVLINSNVLWEDGKFSHARCFTRDITEYKQAQEERNALQAALQRFFNLSLDLLCIAGLDGYFKCLNPAWEKTLGYSNSELQSQPFMDFIHPEDKAATLAEVEKLTTGTPTIYFENRYRCKDGSYKCLAWTAFPNVEDGLLYCVARDITELKRAEQERLQLLQREQAARNQITKILESITDAFFALDNEWRFTYVNQQAELLSQRKREELLGKCVWDEFPEAVTSLFYEEYHRALREQVSVEFEAFYPPLNSWFWVHAYPGEQGLSVYYENINDRKQAQEELQRQNQRSQLFAEITLKIRQSLQLEEILQTTVTEIQKILQVDRVLLYRIWPNGTGCTVTEEVQPGWPAILGMSFQEEVFPIEYQELYRQGKVRAIADVEQVYAEVTPCLLEFLQPWGVKAKLVVPILLSGQLWGLLIAHHCTSPRPWTSFEIELLQQLSEQIGLALAQSQLLERETRQRLELARSNAELQEFAYVASHDLQEPLRKIQAFGDRLMVKYSEVLTDQGRDYLKRMQNAAERMQALINDLLTLSRVTTRAQPFVPTNLTQVVQEVLSDLEVRIQQTGGRIEVSELPTLEADPMQMRQLLQNLIGNALKFHREGEPPAIKIYSRGLPDRERRPPERMNRAELCQILVEDNGIGFKEKYLDRIFNAFQRLHSRSEYEGTGMGLAICRKIVERHDGSVIAQSIPLHGSTFIITLPLQQRQGDTAK